MTHLRLAMLLIVAAMMFFIVGVWVGIREGSQIALIAEAPPRGVIALRLLAMSKNGARPDQIRKILELYVDQGLVGGYKYLSSPLRPFFESPVRPYLGPMWELDRNSYVEKETIDLANYRKANPSPLREFWSHSPNETPEQQTFIDEGMERQRENARIVDLMVERYASK
jgi:hypothetical protein